MKRKICVLLPESNYNTGDRVYWFNHPDTGDKEFDNNYIKIYESDNDSSPFLRCHICKIKEVEEYMVERKWGAYYLKDEFSQFKTK